LQKINENKYNPVVRILFGLPIINKKFFMSLLKKIAGGWITLLYHLLEDPDNKDYQNSLVTAMQDWLKSTFSNTGGDIRKINYPIFMAFSQPSPLSHNHAKMIVADDSRVITGGHNFGAQEYLSDKAVHDISCLITGTPAKGARQFADKLWTQTVAQTCWKKKFVTDRPPSSKPAEASLKSGNTLALGRLGKSKAWGGFNITSNASKTARVIALCSANSIIRISQQTIGAPINLLGLDFYTCLAILRAVLADVTVQIIVSKDGPAADPYAGFAPEVRNELVGMCKDDILKANSKYTRAPARSRLDTWADLSLNSPAWQLASIGAFPAKFAGKLKKNLQISRSYSSPDVLAYNHSKIYIVDERCFYIGSDNFYVSATDPGLQEFGYLIEDHDQTLKVIDEYWNKAWQNAKPLRVL
jgi:phosphatidylserine/phosphatidylglycerophosphate/cardiolipin synthase-like enzyme